MLYHHKLVWDDDIANQFEVAYDHLSEAALTDETVCLIIEIAIELMERLNECEVMVMTEI
jgi:hypothetical protein